MACQRQQNEREPSKDSDQHGHPHHGKSLSMHVQQGG